MVAYPENSPAHPLYESNRTAMVAGSRKAGLDRLICVACALLTGLLLVPRTRLLFWNTGWRWAYILVLSFGVAFCLNPLVGRIARKIGALDHPNVRKPHQQATPLLGGASVYVAFLTALMINGIYSLELGAMLVASGILFSIGVADDVRQVPAAVKLLTQLGCTILVMSFGVVLRILPVDWGIVGRLGNWILTIVWIVGITNAMNFFDGMDGLASGMGALISFFLGVIAFQTGQSMLGWISVAMLGACLGFLPFNFRFQGDALIFLGDAGSTVIGFVLACVAIYGEWTVGNPVLTLIAPILIFWILIFDMVHITIERIFTGKVVSFRQWIEYVGKDHLHHRLAHVLNGKKKSVLFIYSLSICLGTSAVVLRNARLLDAVLLMLQASIVVVLITILERRGRMVDKRQSTNRIDLGRDRGGLPRVSPDGAQPGITCRHERHRPVGGSEIAEAVLPMQATD